MNRIIQPLFLIFFTLWACVNGFTVPTTYHKSQIGSTSSSLRLNANNFASIDTISTSPSLSFIHDFPATSNTISAVTLDPATAFTQVLGGIINSPVVLLVPILAAVGVASIIAWLIVAYANPADPDE
jgi:hypothetical protein